MKTGPKPLPAEKRFWRHVRKSDRCWEWQGARAGGRGSPTYGVFRVGSQTDGSRRSVYAHRWIWEHLNGPIPEGMQVNHHCDNPICVNPEHLYVGTQSENVTDMHSRGRARGGQRRPAGSPILVVVDSREQKPYRFQRSVTRALRSGDYSVEGLETQVVVERKSKEDAYSSLGRDRERFEREFRRLADFEYAAVIVEAGLSDFLEPPAFSRMHPHAAINTLVSWSVKYGVHVFFADSRRLARALTYRILEKYWKHRGAPDGKRA